MTELTDHKSLWLAENSIECQRFAARISKSACARYRETAFDNPCKGCGGHDAQPLAKVFRQKLSRDAYVSKAKRRIWRKKPEPIKKEVVVRLCSVEGCKNKHLARGWCSTHYSAFVTTPKARAARGLV